jgi:hypothetical protein
MGELHLIEMESQILLVMEELNHTEHERAYCNHDFIGHWRARMAELSLAQHERA